MENVVAFNNELSGLYDSKPPISKAKMASITKAAMRAIKFYKHVVQSVEKFILKCKPEYKVPGLYVIDSIVRQSRHQFGVEKDVFAPRFARNIKETFANLFRCAPEDKSRIIRVLNLWQKNNVFAPDVIQPIFDLADPNHPIYQMQATNISTNATLNDITASSNGMNNSIGGVMDISTMQPPSSGGSNIGEEKSLPDLSKNNLKQLLKDPNVLLQLQTLQNFQKFKQQQEEKQIKLNEMRLQEEAFEKHLQNVLKGAGQLGGPGGVGGIQAIDSVDLSSKEVEFVSEESKIEVINLDGNDSRSPSPTERADRYAANKRRRSRSRSRSRDRANGRDRDNRRRRSRSRSRSSRSPRSNRRRTSRDRERNKNDAREKEKEKDRERDRRRKGIPDIKKGHLSVCSTTLWVGHLSKLVYQEELSDTFGKYGDIVSIDQIVPRGCAFIVMNRRQDANKAMQSLKSYKLQGRAITISWAAGKGVKSKEWKDFWDLELGVTYIPWDKLDENTDLDSLEEGGMFDEDSMPSWMVEKINKLKSIKDNVVTGGIVLSSDNLPNIDMTQPPPGPPPEGMMSMVPPQFSIAPPLGAPPRLMNPMGVPMPGNMVTGIPMPPNMVPGMPPPHPMMMPPGMLPPGFPPLGQMEKNPPPPIMRNDVGSQNSLAAALGTAAGHFMGNHGMLAQMSGPPPMNMPPNQNQFQPPPNFASGQNNTSDDQMDIEMDIEDQTPAPPQVSFTQPPPMFPGGFLPPRPDGSNDGDGDHHEDFGNRDRNRNDRGGSSSSRWGSGGRNDDIGNGDRSVRDGGDGNMDAAPSIWQENNGGFSGGPNFNDSRNGGHGVGPMNLPPPPHDMINPDFFDVRDKFNDNNRRGGGGGGGGPRNVGPPPNGDFFGNIQNRFGQPTSLMQMRIAPPPPNPFNTRMGGPGGPGNQMMFMRGPGGHGGGRHQGPGGFNFNDRPPFERDGHDGMMGGGGGGNRGNDRRGGRRGGGRVGGGGGGGSGNWRDNEDEDGGGMNFRRRGQGGGGGNRFRDGYDDRRSRDKDRMGNRRGGNDRNSRDRDRDRRDNDRNRGGYRRSSPRDNSSNRFNDNQPQVAIDTEEDWDEELSEHSFGEGTSRTGTSVTQENDSGEFSDTKESAPHTETDVKMNSDENTTVNNFRLSPEQIQDQSDSKKSEQPQNVNTPLYDEPSSAPNASSPAKDFESQSEQLISISTTNSETNPAEVTGSEATNE